MSSMKHSYNDLGSRQASFTLQTLQWSQTFNKILYKPTGKKL